MEKGRVTLDEFCKSIANFSGLTFADKIRTICWFLVAHEGKALLKPADVVRGFQDLHVAPPVNMARFFEAMTQRKELIKTPNGYRLERAFREQYDQKYGRREATVIVDKLLTSLPQRLPSVADQEYLREALTCFRVKAYRAAIVMTWNLAFHHLLTWIFDKHLAAFNAQLPLNFPKEKLIVKFEDFQLLSEDQILAVSKSATLLSVSRHKIYKQKLERRNTAAHPSSDIKIEQLTAEEFIADIIQNGVLTLA